MKHSQLHAIAHNYVDSMVSGLGFVVGFCETHVFADAACNLDGSLTIDFLTGKVIDGIASDQLCSAIPIFKNGFARFCERHDASNADFEEFTARFNAGRRGNIYSITVQDRRGLRSSISYKGVPGRRIKMLTAEGRVVPNKTRLS